MAGEQCCENPPALDGAADAADAAVSDVELAGLRCYVSGAADSRAAVVLISDVFGERSLSLSPQFFVSISSLFHPFLGTRILALSLSNLVSLDQCFGAICFIWFCPRLYSLVISSLDVRRANTFFPFTFSTHSFVQSP